MTNYATLNHLVTQYLSRDFQQLSSVILTKKLNFAGISKYLVIAYDKLSRNSGLLNLTFSVFLSFTQM